MTRATAASAGRRPYWPVRAASVSDGQSRMYAFSMSFSNCCAATIACAMS